VLLCVAVCCGVLKCVAVGSEYRMHIFMCVRMYVGMQTLSHLTQTNQ